MSKSYIIDPRTGQSFNTPFEAQIKARYPMATLLNVVSNQPGGGKIPGYAIFDRPFNGKVLGFGTTIEAAWNNAWDVMTGAQRGAWLELDCVIAFRQDHVQDWDA